MTNKPRTLYWDSSVFLSHLNAYPDRKPVIDAVIAEIRENKDSIILTSSESIVEVSCAADERTQNRTDPKIEKAIDDMFNDTAIVRIVDNGPHIAKLARRLIRDVIPQGWVLKPKDAVHLATAQWLSEHGILVNEINTYEPAWKKYEATVGIHVEEPHVIQYKMKENGKEAEQ
ncbi:MAG: type II toxin-antitoxin system VapC family toxin [Anaerolineales bacterium]